MQRRTLRRLQHLQRRNQPLLDVGEIAAERERWQQARFARRLQGGLDALRKVFAMGWWDLEILRQLAGILGLPRQFALKTGVRNREHRRDDLGVGFSPEIGDAIFGDGDIA